MKKRTVRVLFTVRVPDTPDIGDTEILEWLKFELGANGCMSGSNPLLDTDLEADPFSVEMR